MVDAISNTFHDVREPGPADMNEIASLQMQMQKQEIQLHNCVIGQPVTTTSSKTSIHSQKQAQQANIGPGFPVTNNAATVTQPVTGTSTAAQSSSVPLQPASATQKGKQQKQQLEGLPSGVSVIPVKTPGGPSGTVGKGPAHQHQQHHSAATASGSGPTGQIQQVQQQHQVQVPVDPSITGGYTTIVNQVHQPQQLSNVVTVQQPHGAIQQNFQQQVVIPTEMVVQRQSLASAPPQTVQIVPSSLDSNSMSPKQSIQQGPPQPGPLKAMATVLGQPLGPGSASQVNQQQVPVVNNNSQGQSGTTAAAINKDPRSTSASGGGQPSSGTTTTKPQLQTVPTTASAVTTTQQQQVPQQQPQQQVLQPFSQPPNLTQLQQQAQQQQLPFKTTNFSVPKSLSTVNITQTGHSAPSATTTTTNKNISSATALTANSSTSATSAVAHSTIKVIKVVTEGDALRRFIYAKLLDMGVPEAEPESKLGILNQQDNSTTPKKEAAAASKESVRVDIFDVDGKKSEVLSTASVAELSSLSQRFSGGLLNKTSSPPSETKLRDKLGSFLNAKGIDWFFSRGHQLLNWSSFYVHPGSPVEQARALNDGMYRELLHGMKLAEILGKESNSLVLKTYYRLWAAQWVAWYFATARAFPEYSPQAGFFDNFIKKKVMDDNHNVSPKTGGSFPPPPRAYGRKVGRMLLDLMKAAFSQALFLSGLEGAPTERILEAFCEAVVEEKAIVNRLSTCLILTPEGPGGPSQTNNNAGSSGDNAGPGTVAGQNNSGGGSNTNAGGPNNSNNNNNQDRSGNNNAGTGANNNSGNPNNTNNQDNNNQNNNQNTNTNNNNNQNTSGQNTGSSSSSNNNVQLSITDRLLLVTTMTMMLSTEVHNPAAMKNRIWTRDKFAHVGIVDCGVQASVMKKIYDRIREFPILGMGEGGSPG